MPIHAFRRSGTPNAGPQRRSSPRARTPFPRGELSGRVRWIERDDPSVLVTVDSARGDLRALSGRDVLVRLDAGRAAIELADRDRDGELTLDDVALGDRVRVSGRLVRMDGAEAVVQAGRAILTA